MSLKDFARQELTFAGLFEKDSDYEGMLGDAAMELIECFAGQDHSGYSAMMLLDIFNRLARFKTLTPLTGNDNEWMDLEQDNGDCQSVRCPTVFKNKKTGEAWDIDLPPVNGAWQRITFPYMPGGVEK